MEIGNNSRSIIEIIKTRKAFSIFGTGTRAEYLFELLDDLQFKMHYFVVSNEGNKEDKFNGKPVVVLKKYKPVEREILLIAVRKKYKDEVIDLVKKTNEYIYIEEEHYKELYRRKNKYFPSSFICNPNPVSRLFGIDRGGAIDRYYIVNFLKDQRAGLNDVRKTLEVGEVSYSEILFPGAKHDVLDFSLGMDLTDTDSLPENEYDCFICTQTLNFIYDEIGRAHV